MLASCVEPQKGLAMNSVNLTTREFQVLQRLVLGQSNKQIALLLQVGLRTVESHVASMLAKTATHGRTELAAFARTHELIAG